MPALLLLSDPQTSGGQPVACAPESLDAAGDPLHARLGNHIPRQHRPRGIQGREIDLIRPGGLQPGGGFPRRNR
ncbi:hypothetical protein [Pseudogemmobacter bohemicus]|uniref:hypothetical protein n=1 Tax=Pseudogemmobacter bohemicus TaxID=2250708 RepID=UPI000DD2FA36|nr:hypothetical protein [Pseudogemmobacter bohemicus]